MSSELETESVSDEAYYEEEDNHQDSATPQDIVKKIEKGGEEVIISQFHLNMATQQMDGHQIT